MIRLILSIIFSADVPGLSPAGIQESHRKIVELLMCILIISVLVSYAVPIYVDSKTRAKIVHATGSIYTKNSMFVFNAVTGKWPENDTVLDEFNKRMDIDYEPEKNHVYMTGYPTTYLKKIDIENGALHFRLAEELAGKTLTIRPAVPEGYPDGPLILISNKKRQGWIAAGPDKTDLPPSLISRYLR